MSASKKRQNENKTSKPRRFSTQSHGSQKNRNSCEFSSNVTFCSIVPICSGKWNIVIVFFCYSALCGAPKSRGKKKIACVFGLALSDNRQHGRSRGLGDGWVMAWGWIEGDFWRGRRNNWKKGGGGWEQVLNRVSEWVSEWVSTSAFWRPAVAG